MLKNNKELHIIIDIDPGTDDTIALALASTFLKRNISALISSYGNVNGEQTYKNLKSLAQLLDIDCTILKGSMQPMNSSNITYTDYQLKPFIIDIRKNRVDNTLYEEFEHMTNNLMRMHSKLSFPEGNIEYSIIPDKETNNIHK